MKKEEEQWFFTLTRYENKNSLVSCPSPSVYFCISPSCATVGIWELLLLELLLLLLLLWEVMEGLDCNFLGCLVPVEEDDEVEELPLGREPSLGWGPPFLTPLDWRACVLGVWVWCGQCMWGARVCAWCLAPLRSWLLGCVRHGWVWWMGVDLAAGWAGERQKHKHESHLLESTQWCYWLLGISEQNHFGKKKNKQKKQHSAAHCS